MEEAFTSSKMTGSLSEPAKQVLHILERRSPRASNCPLEIKSGYPRFLLKNNVKSSKARKKNLRCKTLKGFTQ